MKKLIHTFMILAFSAPAFADSLGEMKIEIHESGERVSIKGNAAKAVFEMMNVDAAQVSNESDHSGVSVVYSKSGKDLICELSPRNTYRCELTFENKGNGTGAVVGIVSGTVKVNVEELENKKHARVQFNGAIAQAIYDRSPILPKLTDDRDRSISTKSSGGIACYRLVDHLQQPVNAFTPPELYLRTLNTEIYYCLSSFDDQGKMEDLN